MNELKRFTTEYVEAEDRIRITGAAGDAAPIAIWLTLRLLQRLLPPLLEWLELHAGKLPRMDVMQSFAQQTATARMTPQPPVRPRAESETWLVSSIDLVRGEGLVRLTFKSAGGQTAVLSLQTEPLRQWLAIIHTGFRKAGWPQGVWPEWMLESGQPEKRHAALLH